MLYFDLNKFSYSPNLHCAVHRAKKSTLLLMSFTYQIHNWQTEITQGPLKIWNTQISHYKVGGTQKPFTETQLFFAKKM